MERAVRLRVTKKKQKKLFYYSQRSDNFDTRLKRTATAKLLNSTAGHRCAKKNVQLKRSLKN